MNNLGKQRVAQLIAAGLNASQIRVGVSPAAPAPADTTLVGDTVGVGAGTMAVEGTHAKLTVVVALDANETVGEAGLFSAGGEMFDRWVFGPLVTATAGSLVIQWDQEVL